MCLINLPIDIKSLYFNIKNDNKGGHTPTVATPLVQGKSVREQLSQLNQIPENISFRDKEEIVLSILSKSRVEAKINKVFVFDRVSVNGILLENAPAFAMYIREEIDQSSVHFGRQKLHYPQSLLYSSHEINIDNKSVLRAASFVLNDYAFIVDAFEYNTANRTLNLNAIIVGEGGIPYSKVFLNKRGVGEKFAQSFVDRHDSYDTEIIALREHLGYDAVFPENFYDVIDKNKRLAANEISQFLKSKGIFSYRFLSQEYPYSLYDIEFWDNGVKKYIILCVTSTKLQYFTLSINKIQFIRDFSPNVYVSLVTDINNSPSLYMLNEKQLNSMQKQISSITYERREGCMNE